MQKRKSSKALIGRAMAGKHASYRELRGDMEQLAAIVARRYVDQHATVDELIHIGMTHFDFALAQYTKHHRRAQHARAAEKLYKFSTYYAWWIQASIRTYLGHAKEPLVGIKRKPRRPRRVSKTPITQLVEVPNVQRKRRGESGCGRT